MQECHLVYCNYVTVKVSLKICRRKYPWGGEEYMIPHILTKNRIQYNCISNDTF